VHLPFPRPLVLVLTTLLAVLSPAVAPPARADPLAPVTGVWPLQPRPAVVAGFDPPASRYGAGHRGVDLAGGLGARVRTALAGRVSYAGRLAGRGVVVVDHGSTRTTYEPVAATVHVGDRLRAGTVIGRLQLFGSHCFPRSCLHWGLIEGRDHYLDPLTLVGAAPVRLLPLGGALPFPVFGPFPLFGPWTPPWPWTPPVPWTQPDLGLLVVPSTGPVRAGLLDRQARGWAWR